jgi:uncharacterized membrane protein YraQ (UPF0718 family)
MGLCRLSGCGNTSLCMRRGEVPLTAALVATGVGIGPAFTFMQASVGTCLPTLMMLPKLIGMKLMVVYLAFWLVYSVASGILVGWIL